MLIKGLISQITGLPQAINNPLSDAEQGKAYGRHVHSHQPTIHVRDRSPRFTTSTGKVDLGSRSIAHLTRNRPLISELWLGTEMISAGNEAGIEAGPRKPGENYIKVSNMESKKGWFRARVKCTVEFCDPHGNVLSKQSIDTKVPRFRIKSTLRKLLLSDTHKATRMEVAVPKFEALVESKRANLKKPASNRDYMLTFGQSPKFGDRKQVKLNVQYSSATDLSKTYHESKSAASLAVNDATDVDTLLEIWVGKRRGEYCTQLAAENLADQLSQL